MKELAGEQPILALINVAIVANYDNEKAKYWISQNKTNFPFYQDLDMSVYDTFGLDKSVKYSWETAWWHFKAVARGGTILFPNRGDDNSQSGGDVIVNKEGKIEYLFKGKKGNSRPTVKELRNLLKSLI